MAAIGLIILAAILNLCLMAVLGGIGNSLSNLPNVAFGVVDYIGDIIGSRAVGSTITALFAGVGISLLILGFIKKGFETYITYTDGDPDSDPLQLVMLFFKATAILLGFDAIYNWLAYITTSLTTQALQAVRIASGTDFNNVADAFKCTDTGTNLLFCVFGLIFGVLYFVVYFSIVKNAVEIFVLKLGMPIACIGLLNADKGIFKSYMMSFIKAFVTIFVKIFLTQLGFSVMMMSTTTGTSGALGSGGGFLEGCYGLIIGICCVSLAISSPKLLSEFMVPSGGGGVGGAINAVSQIKNITTKFKK